jgi:hypothetical protein
MFCWHKWKKWSPPEEAVKYDSFGPSQIVTVQSRACEKCGKVGVRYLPTLRCINSPEENQ